MIHAWQDAQVHHLGRVHHIDLDHHTGRVHHIDLDHHIHIHTKDSMWI